MTDVCPFDFNWLWLAVFGRDVQCRADRSSDKSFAKSRQRKFFWMQRTAGIGARHKALILFQSENIFLPPMPRTAACVDVIHRALSRSRKQASASSADM
jgi:hypothetical protein